MIIQLRLLAVASFVALTTGCLDREHPSPTSTSHESSLSSFSNVPVASGAPALERALNERIQAFGGVYLDGEVSLVILTTDSVARTDLALEARDVLGAFSRRHPERRELLHRSVVHRTVEFGFEDLWRWRGLLEERLFVDGTAHSIGLSYERNRVTVLVASENDMASAVHTLDKLGVPVAAVELIVEEPPRSTNLNLAHPELRGGMVVFNETVTAGGSCTAGFPGVQNETPVWLTAAHCSMLHPQNEMGTVFTQKPEFGMTSFAGVVVSTPPVNHSTSPPTRYVDVVLIRADSVTPVLQGIGFARVARTTFMNTSGGDGSLMISSSDPHFSVVGEDSSAPLQGQVVQKVGRASGWNNGGVSDNCFTTAPIHPPSGTTPFRYPCQVLVSGSGGWPKLRAAQGDSGSPVFRNIGFGEVIASGLIIAGTYNNSAIFSPMHIVRSELNLSAVFLTDVRVLRVFISGPNILDAPGWYSWEAEGIGGTGTYSYQWRVFRNSVGNWQNLGTSHVQAVSVDGSDGDMILEVTAIDGIATRTETLYVVNSIGCSGIMC